MSSGIERRRGLGITLPMEESAYCLQVALISSQGEVADRNSYERI